MSLCAPRASAAFSRRSLILLAWLAFLGLYAWFYRQALWVYFSQDDFPLLITSQPGSASVLNFFKAGGPAAYRPLTQHFYFYFNQLLFGLDPVGHHLANLTVHLLNALLVGWLASRWIAPWAFLPTAFLYAFHPVHFFEVYWISAITQSGYLFFLLCALAGFSLYRLRGNSVFVYGAYLAAVCACLSKEDSVALPAIVTLSALIPLASDRLSRRSLALSLIPFWLLLTAFWIFRTAIVGIGLPDQGVYQFSFQTARVWEKLWIYGIWIFKGKAFIPGYFLVAFCSLLVASLAFSWRSGRPAEERKSALLLLILAAMAGASMAPSFFIPASVDYYLSFAAASLAWLSATLLSRIPGAWPRAALTALLLLSLLQVSRQSRDFKLSQDNLHEPLPRKAQMCRQWVEQLRSQPPPPLGCSLLFRDIPLSSWEKDWFIYLPMLAWDRVYSQVSAHTKGDPQPDFPQGECVRVWSFSSGDAVPLQGTARPR